MKRSVLISVLLIMGFLLRAQQQFILQSKNLSKPDTVWVFTPDNYESSTGKEFPLLFLLHGWSGYYSYWDEIIGCQSYADSYGFILVCPDGLYDSWYLNSPVASENRYEDFFIRELIPFIDSHFRVNKKEVFITGLSMGGHGALYLFARHPSLFRSAGSLSGLLDLQEWRDQYGIDRILGLGRTAEDDRVLREYSVTGNLKNIQSAGKEIILSCGTDDPFYAINVNFTDACKRRNIPVEFMAGPGGHDKDYWRSAIGGQVQFFYKATKASGR